MSHAFLAAFVWWGQLWWYWKSGQLAFAKAELNEALASYHKAGTE